MSYCDNYRKGGNCTTIPYSRDTSPWHLRQKETHGVFLKKDELQREKERQGGPNHRTKTGGREVIQRGRVAETARDELYSRLS